MELLKVQPRRLLHLVYVLPDCWFLELKQLTSLGSKVLQLRQSRRARVLQYELYQSVIYPWPIYFITNIQLLSYISDHLSIRFQNFIYIFCLPI